MCVACGADLMHMAYYGIAGTNGSGVPASPPSSFRLCVPCGSQAWATLDLDAAAVPIPITEPCPHDDCTCLAPKRADEEGD